VRGALLLGVTLFLAACGNYSNEDLEFMNAVPAVEDISAYIPRAALTVDEAELSRLTHDTILVFNGALKFLEAADVIRTYQPTSRIPAGRVWGPIPMDKQPGWQWRFVVTRDLDELDKFNYRFEVQRIGAGDTWALFFDGWFAAATGVRKGVGHFRIGTDALREAGFPVEINEKREMLKELIVQYSTAAFPVSVTMNMALYRNVDLGFTDIATIRYHHEAQESGAGLMEFAGSDTMGRSFSIVSRWLPTGRGRADATATDGTVVGTRTQCWSDSFEETYNNEPWLTPPTDMRGDPALCPDFSMP
jgi:hypothetical protein